MAFNKPPVDVPSQFGQPLLEHRLRDFLVVLSLDRRVRLEVEAVGEIVADGVARGSVLRLLEEGRSSPPKAVTDPLTVQAAAKDVRTAAGLWECEGPACTPG